MSDNIGNLAYTETVGSHNDSTTTINVDSTSLFPAGSYHITAYNKQKSVGQARIDGEAEIMLASVNDGTSFSVTRGQGGTSPISIPEDYAVIQSITERIFDQKADLEGSTSQTFNVATATNDEHAPRKEQVALLTGGADANFTNSPQIAGDSMNDFASMNLVIADAITGGNTASFTGGARYLKNNNKYFISLRATSINTSGMTAGNVVYLRGLPAPAAGTSGNGYVFSGACLPVNISFTQPPSIRLPGGASVFNLVEPVSGGSSRTLIVSDITSGSGRIELSFSYHA